MWGYGLNPVYSRNWGVGAIPTLSGRRSKGIAWWQAKDIYTRRPRVIVGTGTFIPPPRVGGWFHTI